MATASLVLHRGEYALHTERNITDIINENRKILWHALLYSTFTSFFFSVIPPPLDSSSVFALRMKLAQSAAVNYGINFSNDLLFPPLLSPLSPPSFFFPALCGFFFFFFSFFSFSERISFLSTAEGGRGEGEEN